MLHFSRSNHHNTEVEWGASVNRPTSGTRSEHVWCVPEEAQPVGKSVIAFITKSTRFLQYVPYVARHAFKVKY